MKWIFFFNGWGMTEEAFPHLSLDQVEIINYPYDRIETLLKKHENDTLYAVAWSFGPITFPNFQQKFKTVFAKKLY